MIYTLILDLHLSYEYVKYRPKEKVLNHPSANKRWIIAKTKRVFPHENSLHDGQSFIFLGSPLERSRALKVEKCILFCCTLLLHNNYSFMKKRKGSGLIFFDEKWWKWLMNLSYISTFLCQNKRMSWFLILTYNFSFIVIRYCRPSCSSIFNVNGNKKCGSTLHTIFSSINIAIL